MNDNYKWNGETFNSKGIIIEKKPVIPRANHSYEQYEIPGRDGFLTIDNKTYDPIVFSLECHFKENSNINEIRAWLDGYGTLQIDDEKVYTGYISNSIDFEKVLNFQKFIIQFMLQPIAKSLDVTTNILYESQEYNVMSKKFTSATYTNAYPIIKITCSGDTIVTINDKTFIIYDADGTYILDCESKVITKNGINQSSNMSGEFPYIKPGSNDLSIDGIISQLRIDYRKTYL